jgi:hypothetical protein
VDARVIAPAHPMTTMMLADRSGDVCSTLNTSNTSNEHLEHLEHLDLSARERMVGRVQWSPSSASLSRAGL